jgi:hypothetical protein
VEASDSKNYLTWLSAGNAVFGVPVPPLTQKTDLNFLWPDNASRASILLGGLGCASGFTDWDSEVDFVGLLGTAIVCYGVGVVMMLAGVYIINPFIEFLKGKDAEAFYCAASLIGATALVVGVGKRDTSTGKYILSKLSGIAASVVFGQLAQRFIIAGAKSAAKQIALAAGETVAEITTEEALEQVPYAGWALRVVSIASDLAGLSATTVECLLSPATYELEILRTMDLTVTVSPDPAHGKKGFEPIWPMVSDHFVIQVKYPSGDGQGGGTTYSKAGPMPGRHEQPISVVFEGIPAGGKIEVSANIYSDTDWQCGRWDSGWINADPDQNDQLRAAGNIKEGLVPLTPGTHYKQKQTIAYLVQKHHYWEVTRFSVDSALMVALDKGGKPDTAVIGAFDKNGNTLSANSSIKVVTPMRQWALTDHDQGVTFGIDTRQIAVAKAFYLALAYQTALNKGGATPSSIETAFSDQQHGLPSGTTVTVVKATSKWTIGLPGLPSLYEIVAARNKVTVSQTSWELAVQNTTNPSPPLPAVYPLPAGPTGNQVGALQNIIHNNKQYELGYAWMAAGQNLPLDDGEQAQNVPMYAMQSISTLGQPQDQIIEPTRGFSLPTLIAYDQFGLSELFPLGSSYASKLKDGPVPNDVAKEFSAFGVQLPGPAQVKLISDGKEWQIGPSGEEPLYQLRLVTDEGDTTKRHIAVFSYPVPALDNFYLDPRDHSADHPVYYLRGVELDQPPGQYGFDYGKTKAWGRIANAGTVQGLAVHPHGYVVAADYANHKLYALKLPASAVASDEAPFAMPLSGEGVREGLMQNPQALTITADGRILILEEGNRRIQAFDVKGNPVSCFSVNQLNFSIPQTFIPDLDNHTQRHDSPR